MLDEKVGGPMTIPLVATPSDQPRGGYGEPRIKPHTPIAPSGEERTRSSTDLDLIKTRLQRHFEPEKDESNKELNKREQDFNADICNWVDTLFNYYVNGTISQQELTLMIKQINSDMSSHILQLTARGANIGDTSEIAHLVEEHVVDQNAIDSEDLPDSAQAFDLYNPASGRTKRISSFEDQLSRQLSPLVGEQLKHFMKDHNPEHLKKAIDLMKFGNFAKELYIEYDNYNKTRIESIAKRMKALGLNKNLQVTGDNTGVILEIVKSLDFGRLTPEDRGAKQTTDSSKNIIEIDEEKQASLTPLNTEIKDKQEKPLPPIKDEKLMMEVAELLKDMDVRMIKEHNADNPDILAIIDWVTKQVISRRLLPRESQVPNRVIDRRLTKVKTLGKENSSESFQASNPISLWTDPETHQKFIVKECPDETLQADYFGLEMLQLVGVPVYEFYLGKIATEKGDKKVLISSFLEGFQDPSELIKEQLPSDAPKGMEKTVLPENFKNSQTIQRAMLVELLIGEYNTKAHNLMVLGKSVQHLDQGACLTSTASGKYKGLSEQVTVRDIEDVLHCYTDWDWDKQMPVNEAYAQVAQVENGKLVIKDTEVASKLLRQLQRLPQTRINEALVAAGYKDGPESIARLTNWSSRITDDLLPKYQSKAEDETKRLGHVTARTQQYIRWSESALQSFAKAKEMGGELSYYQYTLARRRESLEKIWGDAIEAAKEIKS